MSRQDRSQRRAAGEISRDSLEYERRGRLLRDDLARESVRRRAAQLLSATGGGHRSSTLDQASTSGKTASGLSKGRSRETVVKVVNWTKSKRSPLSQAKYASQTRPVDDPGRALAMWNEKGEALAGVAIEREILGWNLAPEDRNLTETPTDPEGTRRSEEIRRIAEAALIKGKDGRDGDVGRGRLTDDDRKKAQLYLELNEQIRRRDQGRGRGSRERDLDGGRVR
jgi:hypothetical protein